MYKGRVTRHDVERFSDYFRDPQIGDRLLSVGHACTACQNIRQALRALGYNIAPGNSFDQELERRVLSFQEDHNHRAVDGQVGPGTRRLLTEVILSEIGLAFFERLEAPHGTEQPQVFLSYCWDDSEVVDQVDQWLRDQGIRVWRDTRDFLPGKQIPTLITETIKQADKVIAVYSRKSKARDWTSFEIRIAEDLERDGKEVLIYLVLDDTPLPKHDPNRLAVMAKGCTLKEVGQKLLHGILGRRPEPPRIKINENATLC
jgi:hypothetical protein